MKRLVYAPMARAFIRSSNMSGQIYDVSKDIVEGSVTRRVNDISSAQLVLRNPKFKYTRIKGQGSSLNGMPLFTPMDLVTIWLQRLAGVPIQVFTGYLDETPYLDIYPGNCRITASCTLKRLKYSYFDPGLQFFRNWVSETVGDGWILSPDGSLTNPTAMAAGTTVAARPGEDSEGNVQPVTDGGFGQLLLKFMSDIAGWPPDQVVISNLDPNLPAKASKLYRKVLLDAKTAQDELEAWLGNSMGVTISVPQSDGMMADGTLPAQLDSTLKVIKNNANDVPLRGLVAISIALTGMSPQFNQDGKVGLFALDPSKKYEGRKYTAKELSNPATATALYGRLVVAAINQIASSAATAKPLLKKATINQYRSQLEDGDAATILQIVKAISGDDIELAKVQSASTTAARYILSLSNPNAAASLKPSSVRSRKLTWDSPELTELLKTDDEKSAVRAYAAAKAYWQIASVAYFIKTSIGSDVEIAHSDTQQKESLYLTTPSFSDYRDVPLKQAKFLVGDWHANNIAALPTMPPLLMSAFLSLRGETHVKSVTLFVGSEVYGRIENGTVLNTPGGAAGTAFPNTSQKAYLRIVMDENASIPDSWHVPSLDLVDLNDEDTAVSEAEADDNDVAVTFAQIAQMATNAAFTTSISFPSNIAESNFLQGEKSLMNDVSCLDAIQQFAGASMRNFMSLPDGRFCAFYPDYFAAQRKPYWPIYDIELENFAIQLNDINLKTHVFVVGDIMFNGTVDFMDRISSAGVASVTMSEIIDSFVNDSYIVSEADDSLSDGAKSLIDADMFLQKFGARPHVEEQPIIRRPDFEFLLAYQRFMQFWASQFATEVDISFQPEVMAGGIVWLPQHGIQLYTEEVSHTFSYESGFDTTAVFSAPSIANVKGWRDIYGKRYPGFAIAGVSTVMA